MPTSSPDRGRSSSRGSRRYSRTWTHSGCVVMGRVADLYDRSLGWLVTNLDFVGVPVGPSRRREVTCVDVDRRSSDGAKDLGELAMLYRIAKRFPRSTRCDELLKIRKHVAASTPTDAAGSGRDDSFLHRLRTAIALDACDADPEPCRGQ